jgi:hypothetical protein
MMPTPSVQGSVDLGTGDPSVSGSLGPVSYDGNTVGVGPSAGVRFNRNSGASIYAEIRFGMPDGHFFTAPRESTQTQ